jgi:hypothetical protein
MARHEKHALLYSQENRRSRAFRWRCGTRTPVGKEGSSALRCSRVAAMIIPYAKIRAPFESFISICLAMVAKQFNLGRKSDALTTQKTGRNVNREGQRWTEDRAGMTLRLPIDLREAVTEEARVAGDLSRVVLFALRNVERKNVTVTQTRKAGLPLSKPQLLHVGAEARSVIRAWAKDEGVSVNAIMVSVLDEFFRRLRKSKALREELRLELRARRGFLPS